MDETRLKLHEDICIQEMGPEEKTVVLSLETGDLYTCNDTTCEILRIVETAPRTFNEITEEMLRRYDVRRDRLEDDLRAIIQHALEEKLILLVE